MDYSEGGRVILYHFTCDHHVASIRREGLVRPNRHPFFPMAAPPISWWTDLSQPSQRAIGLTQTYSRCNRLAHRLQAETDAGLMAWEDWAAAHRIGWAVRLNLADDPLAQPDRWWVAEEPVAVITANSSLPAGTSTTPTRTMMLRGDATRGTALDPA